MALRPVLVPANGRTPEIQWGCYEDDDETFEQGNLVTLTAGAVVEVASDATAKIAGIALAAGTNVKSGHIEIPFLKILPGDKLMIWCTTNGTDKSAADFTVGENYSVLLSSNIHMVDHNDTGNDVFKFLRPISKVSGATSYIGLVQPLDAFLEYA